MMFYGFFPLSFWGYVALGALLTQITIFSVTIFLHRAQAHRAISLHSSVEHFFRFWLWLTTGMTTRAWASIHRKHHAKVETKEDPHSPQILGLPKVLWEGAELYRKEAKNPETLEKYGHGTPNDRLEKFYEKTSSQGIILLLIINIVLFGVPGVALWAVQMMWIPFFAAGVINGIGHYWGYRNFACQDTSTNIIPWAFFIGGEELHNNHHTFPTSAKFSIKWWEIDIGWGLIMILKALGLAKVKKLSPKLTLAANKKCIDIDTIKAIVSNRFQILADYSRKVIIPTAKSKAISSPKAFKRSLVQLQLDQQDQTALEKTLENDPTLKVVYQFRQKLQNIWERTTASHKELIEALQEWCQQAEASNINALRDFSLRLKNATS